MRRNKRSNVVFDYPKIQTADWRCVFMSSSAAVAETWITKFLDNITVLKYLKGFFQCKSDSMQIYTMKWKKKINENICQIVISLASDIYILILYSPRKFALFQTLTIILFASNFHVHDIFVCWHLLYICLCRCIFWVSCNLHLSCSWYVCYVKYNWTYIEWHPS